jgi:hypothetical protein
MLQTRLDAAFQCLDLSIAEAIIDVDPAGTRPVPPAE